MCKGCILYINRKVQPCVKPITGSWGRTLVVRRTPPRNASKPLPACSYASPVGVVEDKSVKIGFPDGHNKTTGS